MSAGQEIAILLAQKLPAMERIDEGLIRVIVVLHDKVPRQSDAEHRAPQTPAYLNINHGQCYGGTPSREVMTSFRQLLRGS